MQAMTYINNNDIGDNYTLFIIIIVIVGSLVIQRADNARFVSLHKA